MKATWKSFTAKVLEGETPETAIDRKIKRVIGVNYFLHRESFNDGAGPLYRLAESRKDGIHLFGRMARIKTQ